MIARFWAGVSRHPEERSVGASEAKGPWHTLVYERLKANRFDFAAYVPDLVLAPLCEQLESDDAITTVIATREEEAVGLVCGAHLGGKRPLLLLQSSGFGNTLNAFGTLALPYQIPFLVILSPRGILGEFNPVQVPLGRAVPSILDSLGIQHYDLADERTAGEIVDRAAKLAFNTRSPVALLVSPLLSGGKEG
jgi:sulfopyruvate decarboxylase alpha subunit